MSLLQMAESLRSLANMIEQNILSPKKLKLIDNFLLNFSSPKISSTLSTPEDFSSRCPPEVLEHILHFLPPKDLKSAVLVNKKWLEVGGRPNLWHWAKLSLQSGQGNFAVAFALLKGTRGIRSLKALQLSSHETMMLVAAVAENESLEEVHLEGCSLNQVEPGLLSIAVSHLAKVNLQNLIFTEEQLASFFSCTTTNCNLSSLIVEEVNLSRVAPDLLLSVAKLAELTLSSTLLTTEQTRLLWTAIGEEGNFSSFKFEGVNLASIDTEALAKVATKASKISLCNTSLTADQVNALAIALATNSQIQEVDLSDNFLTDINPEMLARAVARTRKLSLVNTGLTTDQVNQLLESLLSEASIMEDLDLSANILSFIEPDLMAHSLNKLKMVTLLDSAVSVNQVW